MSGFVNVENLVRSSGLMMTTLTPSNDERLFPMGPTEHKPVDRAAHIGALLSVEKLEEEVDALECTLEDEEAAHQDTLRLWNESKAEVERLREEIKWLREVVKGAFFEGYGHVAEWDQRFEKWDGSKAKQTLGE
jgi:hypothetical protein